MELGPIRPPSEAESLMLRVTRGCHWNKCYFCDLYKKYRFSRRKYEEIEEDLKKAAGSEYAQNYTTCFLQDGDAFVLRTEFLIQILEGIHKYLPNIKHVTTYLVNLNHIRYIKGFDIYLDSGTILPLAQKKAVYFKSLFQQFQEKKLEII